ncbi:MAG: hypothetical protein ABUS49_10685 [Acidobacteriota bacterium]
MREEDIRGLFREMRDEPVPMESLVRLRAGVAERTRPRMWRWWRFAALLLIPACIALLAVLFHPVATVPPAKAPAIARQPPAPVEMPLVSPERIDTVRRLTHHRVARPRRTEQPEAPAVIRIETPDPDVVILLLGD